MIGSMGGIETLMQAMDSSAGEVSYILGGWVLDLYPRELELNFGPIYWVP